MFKVAVVFADDKNQCFAAYNRGSIKNNTFTIKDKDGIGWIFPLHSVKYILTEPHRKEDIDE